MFVTTLVFYLCPSQAPPVRLPDGRGHNGIITNYSVLYQLDSSLQASEIVMTTDNSTSVVLQDLMHSSVYHVMVAANTRVGIGPYTVAMTGRTLYIGNNSAIVCIRYCVN